MVVTMVRILPLNPPSQRRAKERQRRGFGHRSERPDLDDHRRSCEPDRYPRLGFIAEQLDAHDAWVARRIMLRSDEYPGYFRSAAIQLTTTVNGNERSSSTGVM